MGSILSELDNISTTVKNTVLDFLGIYKRIKWRNFMYHKEKVFARKIRAKTFFAINIYQNLTTSGSCVNELKVAVAFFK